MNHEGTKAQRKYKAYPEYKDSGVEWLGDIPIHWDAKRLGQFFEERREKVSDVDYPALSVTMQGIVPQIETAAKTDAGDNRKLVLKSDFVINSRSDRKGSSGVSPFDGSVSLISIVMEPKRIVPSYAHHLLRSYPFQEEFYRFGKGIVADLWSTNSSEMKNILIPEAPKDEQESIANFLDHETGKIDTLIEKQQQLIKLLKEKRQAVISHAVTKGLNPDVPMRDSGIEWLGEVPAHWELKKLGHAFRVDNNLRTPIDRNERAKMLGEYPYYGPTGILDYIDGYSVEGTYFLIGEDGDHFVKFKNKSMTLLVEGKFNVNNHAHLITGNEQCSTDWGCLYFEHMDLFPWLIKQGVGRYKLRKESLLELPVLVPPPSEQDEILQVIGCAKDNLDSIVARTEQLMDLLKERRTALISAAVTGKIDVRDHEGEGVRLD